MNQDDLWIFGYGSLLWRPGFAYTERQPALINGWARRFWQGSTDHRGVPGAPGRVVTLAPDKQARCWGMAYRLAPGHGEQILAELDVREQGGYEKRLMPLRLPVAERTIEQGLVYLASARNPDYLGPAPLADMARQILGASGPSGANPHYVFALEAALLEMGVADDEVLALAARLRALGAPGE